MHLQPSSRQRELIALARRLACERFALRADRHDRAASFPFDDYADLRTEGLLGLCVPERYGGLGADYEPRYLSTERWQWRRNRSNGCGEMDSIFRSRPKSPATELFCHSVCCIWGQNRGQYAPF
jgi:Acyl-CoA dehydrogenase, N-terminal domain